MNTTMQLQALNRIAERLQELKKQNLRIQVWLMHRLFLGEDIAAPPEISRCTKQARGIFGGVSGVLSNVLIPTKTRHFQAGKEAFETVTDQPAGASNRFVCTSPCNNTNHNDREPIESDFWSIANDIGDIVLAMRPTLVANAGLWSIWKEMEVPSCESYRGVWLDFVFEVAWLKIAGLPLKAKKQVYWNGVSVEFENYDRIMGGLKRLRPQSADQFGDAIPRPIPQWYSTIEDIVGASQYALDYLISVVSINGLNGVEKSEVNGDLAHATECHRDKEAALESQLAKVRANEPHFIFATNHDEPNLCDCAKAVNKAIADTTDKRSQNKVAADFFSGDVEKGKKMLARIRKFEREQKNAAKVGSRELETRTEL